MNGEKSWRISGQTWLALLGLGVALWLTTTYFGLILEISAVLFGAYLLSLAIRPLADKFEHWHLSRAITVSLVYVALLGVGALMALLLVPVVRSEIASLRQDAPILAQQISDQLAATPLAASIPSLNTAVQALSSRLGTVVMDAASTAVSIANLLLDLLVLLILAYFLAVERTGGLGWMERWVPHTWRTQVTQMEENIVTRLSRWVWAQAGIALYFALTSTIALFLLDIPYALTIGVVGGVLEVVPYLGGLIAATLAILSALTINVWLALAVLLLYIALATVESHIVAPFLYGRAIGLRSAGVLIALLIGAKAAGVIGVFFAVPVAVVITALVQAMRAPAATTEATEGVSSEQGERA